MDKKKCRVCGEVKSLEEYHRHPSVKDGRDPRCKECQKKRGQEQRALKAILKPAEPAAQACEHKHLVWGDYTIEKQFPGFFDVHPRSDGTFEWEVCRDCGAVRKNVFKSDDAPGIGKVLAAARVTQEATMTANNGHGTAQEPAILTIPKGPSAADYEEQLERKDLLIEKLTLELDLAKKELEREKKHRRLYELREQIRELGAEEQRLAAEVGA